MTLWMLSSWMGAVLFHSGLMVSQSTDGLNSL